MCTIELRQPVSTIAYERKHAEMTILIVILALLGLILLSLLWTGYKGYYFPIRIRNTEDGIKKVACVGDSITYGFQINNWFSYQYPRLLQILLGDQWYVRNFGLSGSTAMRSANMSFRRFTNYRKSLAFQPDIVVIMFGTNDANPQNWRGEDVYRSEYRDLLRSYQSLSSKPDLFLMTPPAPFRTETEADAAMKDHIELERESIQALASELNGNVIDLFTEAKEHPDWFQADGIHPNAKGAMEIARLVYDRITKDYSK